MNKTQAAFIALMCFTAALIGGIVVSRSQPQKLGSTIDTPIYAYNNATSTTVGTNSVQVLATSTSRRYLSLQNIGATTAYCSVNGMPAVDQQGFFMTGSSTRNWEGASLYTGAIFCIASTSLKMVAIEAY